MTTSLLGRYSTGIGCYGALKVDSGLGGTREIRGNQVDVFAIRIGEVGTFE